MKAKLLSIIMIMICTFSILSVNAVHAVEMHQKSQIIPYAPGDYGHYFTKRILNEKTAKYMSNYFIKYSAQTPFWTQSESYSINHSLDGNFSFQVPYKSMTFTLAINFNKGVQSNIPADPKRFSKLGLFTDVKIIEQTVFHEEHSNGRVIRSWIQTEYRAERVNGKDRIKVVYE